MQRCGEEEPGQPCEQPIRGEGRKGPGCRRDRKPHLARRVGRLGRRLLFREELRLLLAALLRDAPDLLNRFLAPLPLRARQTRS